MAERRARALRRGYVVQYRALRRGVKGKEKKLSGYDKLSG